MAWNTISYGGRATGGNGIPRICIHADRRSAANVEKWFTGQWNKPTSLDK
jgi:hypothetical protein